MMWTSGVTLVLVGSGKEISVDFQSEISSSAKDLGWMCGYSREEKQFPRNLKEKASPNP